MNCSPTLTADEFKDLHNAKCELHSVLNAMEGVVAERLYEKFAKALAQIENSLRSSYSFEDAEDAKYAVHVNAVSDEIGIKKTVWSMNEIPDLRAPHPFPDAVVIAYSAHWGPGEVKARIEGPLWSDLWKAAEAAIVASGDRHHVFIEGIVKSKHKDSVLELHTGS